MRNRISYAALVAIALAPMILALGGCNTMEGVGEDLGAAGQGIENSAERNKEY